MSRPWETTLQVSKRPWKGKLRQHWRYNNIRYQRQTNHTSRAWLSPEWCLCKRLWLVSNCWPLLGSWQNNWVSLPWKSNIRKQTKKSRVLIWMTVMRFWRANRGELRKGYENWCQFSRLIGVHLRHCYQRLSWERNVVEKVEFQDFHSACRLALQLRQSRLRERACASQW